MSRIELIKKTSIKNEVIYHIEVDGKIVDDSFCVDPKKALSLYDKVKFGLKTNKEVIKSEEI